MILRDWLRKRKDQLSREFLRRLQEDEGGPVYGDDPNLLGLDIATVCGEDICADVESASRYSGDAVSLHDRAKVILYG